MILTARATALALAFTAILSFPSGTRAQDRTTRELFPNTTDWGRAAVEFESDDLEVVAAYYYSQRHHDSRWLLIELAVSASKPMRIDREDITLITPDGQAVPELIIVGVGYPVLSHCAWNGCLRLRILP